MLFAQLLSVSFTMVPPAAVPTAAARSCVGLSEIVVIVIIFDHACVAISLVCVVLVVGLCAAGVATRCEVTCFASI